MIPYSDMKYHPTAEKVVQILCNKTQSTDPLFFRILVGYFFSLAASHMRATISSPDRGQIPINMYALNLAPSGFGKSMSTNLLETKVLNRFRERFLEDTFPTQAELNLPKLATKRSYKYNTDPDEELEKVTREFNNQGTLLFSFDSGTAPAVKQLRHKLLMAQSGSLNLIIDEIGLNLTSSKEVLDTFIELYDTGLVKQKLVKNTSENVRSEEIVGATPANLLMFGVPTKLFDGGKTEEDLFTMLDTGYARRCFFGYAKPSNNRKRKTAEEIYEMRTNGENESFLDTLSTRLEQLADVVNINRKISVSKDISLKFIEYGQQCLERAEALPDHMSIRKSELTHRDFKALKLAGAYAFIDNSLEITEEHLYAAIKLTEDSGQAFELLLSRDKAWVRLAKYIATVGEEVTQADLAEDLHFYKGSASAKQDMLSMAIAYGYKNNIIIKKKFEDGIEFLRGETLKETDLKRCIISYSTDYASDYVQEYAPFDQLHKLTQAPNMHWTSHHLIDGYRREENVVPGFNLVVLDVDSGTNLETVRALLKDYTYHLYTTKRHTDTENRFRIILPTNFELKLDAKDYKEFMCNIFEWLPFEVDTSTSQRARKWASHNMHYEYNEGELLDVLPFIPKTSKNDARKSLLQSQQSMDNLERWVMNNSGDGNRNNMLLRYGMILVDAGFDYQAISTRVLALNDKLPDKLDDAEIYSTILVTVNKALAAK